MTIENFRRAVHQIYPNGEKCLPGEDATVDLLALLFDKIEQLDRKWKVGASGCACLITEEEEIVKYCMLHAQDKFRAEKAESRINEATTLLREAKYLLRHTKCIDEDAIQCPSCSLESRIDTFTGKT